MEGLKNNKNKHLLIQILSFLMPRHFKRKKYIRKRKPKKKSYKKRKHPAKRKAISSRGKNYHRLTAGIGHSKIAHFLSPGKTLFLPKPVIPPTLQTRMKSFNAGTLSALAASSSARQVLLTLFVNDLSDHQQTPASTTQARGLDEWVPWFDAVVVVGMRAMIKLIPTTNFDTTRAKGVYIVQQNKLDTSVVLDHDTIKDLREGEREHANKTKWKYYAPYDNANGAQKGTSVIMWDTGYVTPWSNSLGPSGSSKKKYLDTQDFHCVLGTGTPVSPVNTSNNVSLAFYTTDETDWADNELQFRYEITTWTDVVFYQQKKVAASTD